MYFVATAQLIIDSYIVLIVAQIKYLCPDYTKALPWSSSDTKRQVPISECIQHARYVPFVIKNFNLIV